MSITPKRDEPIWLIIFRLLRWDKPEGRLILMVPALWAVFLAARGSPPAPLVGVIVLGTLATSAAGCVVNDLWDRNIDPKVQRTQNRPLAARTLSIQVGLVVALVAFGCAWVLSLYLNPFTFWLCVAAVPIIICYPLAKRIFPIPQLVLAIAWGFAVLISWSAVSCNTTAAATPCFGAATWLLWGATILWTLGFDIVYGMSDREDDRRIGIQSGALFFGPYVSHAVGAFFGSTTLLLAILGNVLSLNLAFWITLVIAALTWAWQYYRLCQKIIPHHAYAQIFKQNVAIGFILLVGMILGAKG